jgi:predicted transposase YdaD
LRQGDQECCLADRQPARLLAEIGEAGRADALEIAAIGREVEIEVEDLRPW